MHFLLFLNSAVVVAEQLLHKEYEYKQIISMQIQKSQFLYHNILELTTNWQPHKLNKIMGLFLNDLHNAILETAIK